MVQRNKIAATHTQKDKECLYFYEEKLISSSKLQESTCKKDAIMTQMRRNNGRSHLHSSE